MLATTTRLQRLFLWVAPAIVTAGYIAVAVVALMGQHVPVVLWLVGAVMVLLAWWSFLSVPRSVLVRDSRLVFVVPRHNFDMAIEEIRQIDSRKWNRGYVIFSSSRKEVFLLRGMPNLGAVVALVLERNVGTRLKGQTP
jgi:hypothetical protein